MWINDTLLLSYQFIIQIDVFDTQNEMADRHSLTI